MADTQAAILDHEEKVSCEVWTLPPSGLLSRYVSEKQPFILSFNVSLSQS